MNDDIQKWSYFEKVERLKRKIIQVHKTFNSSTQLDVKRCTDTDTIHLKDSQIVAHPDWREARSAEHDTISKAASENQAGVISFEDYSRQRQ